jgi:succinate dehydrogenase membrane anchor subunit
VRTGFTGLAAWLVQRASAVYMLLFLLFVLAALALRPIHGYDEWRLWVARPVFTLALGTFFAALLAHMWVGLRDVLLDYARPAGLRKLLLGLVAAGLVGIAVWVVRILFVLHA